MTEEPQGKLMKERGCKKRASRKADERKKLQGKSLKKS
jgi:hypothetical protein